MKIERDAQKNQDEIDKEWKKQGVHKELYNLLKKQPQVKNFLPVQQEYNLISFFFIVIFVDLIYIW